MKSKILGLLAVVLLAGSITAHAVVVFPPGDEGLGARIFVTSTDSVIATFEGGDDGYTSDLYYLDTSGFFVELGTKNVTAEGFQVDLGSFAIGTELLFAIYVRNTGYWYYNGPESTNPDYMVHARATGYSLPNTTVVGFESLYGGGDRDFNDVMFTLTNTGTSVPVPEPGTFALLGLGLLGLGVSRRKA